MNTQYKQLTQKDRGFTIIEVVLVLAIAGLIFLMVFLALPALQRGQRDTQRKDDMARLQTAVLNYTSNNKGNLPTFNATFLSTYLKPTTADSFKDPNGTDYTLNTALYPNTTTNWSSTYSDTTAVIYVTPSAKCDATDSTKVVGAGSRFAAFRMQLEAGTYCVNN